MKFLLLVLLLQLCTVAHPQIDPLKLDSLAHTIDSQSKAVQQQQERFKNQQQHRNVRKLASPAANKKKDALPAYLIPLVVVVITVGLLLVKIGSSRRTRP